MPALALLLASAATAAKPPPAPVDPAAPLLRVVEDSLDVPAAIEPQAALDAVSDIARIFELYEPSIPWVPGVKIHLEKQVVSTGEPTVLELPVTGNVAGKDIVERARVTASASPTTCDGNLPGRTVLLDFEASSYNIERRIDRIEIEACLRPAVNGVQRIDATGKMYAGFLPEDPALNGMMESIGAKAIQVAFFKQVEPILDAVVRHWGELR
jgi:hypothetical protein